MENCKKTTIYRLNEAFYNDFFNFIELRHPGRKDIKEKLIHLVFNNPLNQDKSEQNIVVAYNPSDHVVGQIICNPIEFYFKGKKELGYKYFDYYVSEKYRRYALGLSIFRKAVKEFCPCIIVNANETTKKIVSRFNIKQTGLIYKYLWITNPFNLVKILSCTLFGNNFNEKKNKYATEFPHFLTCKNYKFTLLKSVDAWKHNHSWSRCIEFARTREYLNKILYLNHGIYKLYLNDSFELPIYFLAKSTLWKGLNTLEVIDYRTQMEDDTQFNLIVNASKTLAKKADFDAAIIWSSHSFFDKSLAKNYFLRVGKPIYILSNLNLSHQKKGLANRNLIYATPIDS